jgi:hypothetical protein
VVEIHPPAHAGDRLPPLRDVAQHEGPARFVEHIHAAFADGARAGQTQLLLRQRLDGQAVTVPAETPLHVVPAHGLVARNNVLDRARQQVSVVRQPGGKRRAVVEHVFARAAALIERFLEGGLLLPEAENLLLQGWKADLVGHRFEHVGNPLLTRAERLR